jgi:hypothetical protein
MEHDIADAAATEEASDQELTNVLQVTGSPPRQGCPAG